MNRMQKNKGITLVELIITMSIMGIVMMGVVSADYAIQKFYKDSSSGAVTGFNAIAMINNIKMFALLATGSYTNPTDKGILIDSSIGGTDTVATRTFCVRTALPNTWKCFSTLNDAGGVHHLYSCDRTTSLTACTTADNKIAPITSMTASFVLNTSVGTQSCLFTISLVVPDTDTTTKTYVAKLTPPNHRL